jgi:hypothetical protein
MPRDKYNSRQTPTDLDQPPPALVLEFDYQRNTVPGADSWPARHYGQRFGPSMVQRALRGGLVVYAEIAEAPYPIAIKEARWVGFGKILEVKTLEGWRVPERLFTRPDVTHLTGSGLLLEKKETG